MLLLTVVAGCVLWPLVFGPEPDDAAIAAAVADRLPSFVRLESANVIAVRAVAGQRVPTFTVSFFAKAALTATVYVRHGSALDVTCPGDARVEGTPVALSGVALMRRVGGHWTSALTMNQPALFAGVPIQSASLRP